MNQLSELEGLRKKTLAAMFVGLIVGTLTLFAHVHQWMPNSEPLWPAGFLAAGAWLVAFRWGRRYKRLFKREFVPRELKQWLPEVEYQFESPLDAEAFRRLGLCSPHFNRFRSEDSIYVDSHELEWRFCEVHAQLVRRHGKNSSTRTVFQGHLISTSIPQIPANLTLRIESDLRDRFLMKLPEGLKNAFPIDNLFKEDQATVRFDEDPDFERSFRVVCSDLAFTRGFVTEELREKLKSSSKSGIGQTVTLSIQQQKLYLAFPQKVNRLEAPWIRSLSSSEIVGPFVAELKKEIEWLRFVVSILA
jgi:hypothetical protein